MACVASRNIPKNTCGAPIAAYGPRTVCDYADFITMDIAATSAFVTNIGIIGKSA
jgi:hypothetical protein